MIEFKVSYWELGEYRDSVELAVEFTEKGVQVTATDVATFTPAQWDTVRQYVNENTHDHWATAYGGTSIREDLNAEKLEATTMMAFGALHVLTPTAAEAAALEANPKDVPTRFTGRVLEDGLGNAVRVIGPVSPAEERAAAELMQKGQLQKLSVVVTPKKGPQSTYVAFFMPFHVPIVANDELSDAAHALKSKIPK